jgi:Icc-related predicted phosphoesterase
LPGNHDPYEIIDLFKEYGVNLHGKHKEFKGEHFIGWGGALTPFGTAFEPTEIETKSVLGSLSGSVETGNFVLVLHNPPYGTDADMTSSGEHTGSKEIRDFIDKMKPKVVISAHIHEARGISDLNGIKILNPGPFYAGYYGIIEINGKDVICKTKKVELEA